MSAVTSNHERVQIIGFAHKNWNKYNSSRGGNDEQQKVYDDFSSRDLKVLGVLYNDKHKERCDY